MADLLTTGDDEDGDELDEDDYKILEDAGMVFKSSAKGKGKARQTDSKHVIFVDNEAQGTCIST